MSRSSSAPWTEALVADDDALWLQQLGNCWAGAAAASGWPATATSGCTAIRERPFDLSIVEPNLPGRLWYSLMHDVRSHAPHARLLITTAFPSRALVQVARSLGAEAVLPKPVRLERLEQLVRDPVASAGPAGSSQEASGRPRRSAHPLAGLAGVGVHQPRAPPLRRQRDGGVAAAPRTRQTLYRKLRKHPPPV